MGFLNDDIIKQANNVDAKLRGHIYCLDKVGFYGTSDKDVKEIDRISQFLLRKNIPHERNNRASIWLDELPEVLKSVFRKP